MIGVLFKLNSFECGLYSLVIMKMILIVSWFFFIQFTYSQVDSEIRMKKTEYEVFREKYKQENTTKGFSVRQQAHLDSLLKEMELTNDASFEFNYLKYVNGNHDISLFSFLKKAYQLNSNDFHLYDDFIAYYEIQNNELKKKEFTEKLMSSRAIEKGVYLYNENVLRSVDRNGILITNGFDDTYPIWVLQNEKGERNDVKVLSLDLLQNKEYRIRILKEYNLIDPGFGPDKEEFLLKICQLNSGKNLFLGFTLPKSILRLLSNDLKNTGLTLMYSPKKLDEDKLLINYRSKLNLAYLNSKQENEKVKKLNANYLVSLIQLHKKLSHNIEEQKKIERIAIKIAQGIGKESLIKSKLGY